MIDAISGWIFKQVLYVCEFKLGLTTTFGDDRPTIANYPLIFVVCGILYGGLAMLGGAVMHTLYDRTHHPRYIKKDEEEAGALPSKTSK